MPNNRNCNNINGKQHICTVDGWEASENDSATGVTSWVKGQDGSDYQKGAYTLSCAECNQVFTTSDPTKQKYGVKR